MNNEFSNFDIPVIMQDEKIKVTFLEIIVTGKKEKPYFNIMYKEVGG